MVYAQPLKLIKEVELLFKQPKLSDKYDEKRAQVSGRTYMKGGKYISVIIRKRLGVCGDLENLEKEAGGEGISNEQNQSGESVFVD